MAVTKPLADQVELKRASIPVPVRIQIWARAAGRCVLCAKYLIDERWQDSHYHSALLVGELAHNVGATSGKGSPRGDSGLSKAERQAATNLLLLCHDCHRSIDNEAVRELFTVDWLTARKYEHEMRVRRATNFSTLHRTLVVTTRGPIRGTQVSVSDREVATALIDSGLVLHVEDGTRGDVVIDLGGDLATAADWNYARRTIDRGLRKLSSAVEDSRQAVDHVSVFALAPVPLLVYLGSQLDDKMSMLVFDHHRGRADDAWCWNSQPKSVPSFKIVTTGDPQATPARDVVAALSVSGTVRPSNIPADLQDHPRIELSPADNVPRAGMLDSLPALDAAAQTWIELLGHVEARWPNAERLHLIGAIPASLAVRAGSHIMRSAHWDTIVYQLTDDDGYQPTPPISNHESQD